MGMSALNKIQVRLKLVMSSVNVANLDKENILSSTKKLDIKKASKFHTQPPKLSHHQLFAVEERLDCPQFDDPDSKRGDLPTWMSRSQIEVVLQGTNQADLALNWIPLAGRDIVSDCPNEEMIQTTTSCCLVIAKIREFLEIWSRQ